MFHIGIIVYMIHYLYALRQFKEPVSKRARSQSPSRTVERERERTGTETEDRVKVSGSITPVQTKVKRLETKIEKETKRKNVLMTITKMIQPTLMSFMDIRSGLKGQERVGSQTPPKQAKDLREGQGALSEHNISPEHGEGRVRPPMRGSPEHLLLHEAKVLTKGRKVSECRKKFEGAESLESRKDKAKPGGKQSLVNTEKKKKGKTRSDSKLAIIASSEPQRGWRERKLRVPRDKNLGLQSPESTPNFV